MNKIADKIVWITGASSGIGEALAYEFSKRGARLILSARNEIALKEVKGKLTHPDKAYVLTLDLSNYDSFNTKVDEAIKAFGGIDILVNNGGVSQRSSSLETGLDVDKKLMEINYLGTVGLTKALLPHFTSKRSGQIVTTSSVVGLYGVPGRASYSASKHAIHGFFDALRAEVYDYGIKIGICCPGYVRTNVSINALTADGSKQGTMDEATNAGIDPDVFARQYVDHIIAQDDEFHIVGLKEKMGIILSKYLPWLFKILVRKLKTT